jgi:D-3-phosphoglycerate dehydrogenase
MITQFTGAFSSKGINVSDMVSKSRGDWAYTIFDISEKADASIIDAVKGIDGVVKVRIVK